MKPLNTSIVYHIFLEPLPRFLIMQEGHKNIKREKRECLCPQTVFTINFRNVLYSFSQRWFYKDRIRVMPFNVIIAR